MTIVKEFDLVIHGATGYTGALVAEYLATRPDMPKLRLALCGRSRQKLEAVRIAIGGSDNIGLIEADAGDPASIDAMVARTKSVISTVGPYQFYGEALVASCAKQGVDYFDLCGEPGWMRAMIDCYDEIARSTRARILFSCGFDSIPFELGVFAVQNHMRAKYGHPASLVKARLLGMRGGWSGGTVASLKATMEAVEGQPGLIDLLNDPFALTPGFRGPAQPSGNQAPVLDLDLNVWTAPFVMEQINTRNVHRSNMLMNYLYGEEFTYEERIVTGPGAAGEAAARLVATAPSLLNDPSAPKPGQGPSEAERNGGFYEILFLAKNSRNQQSRIKIRGDRDPGYGSTSRMISETAICMLENGSEVAGGIWTPGAALRAKLIEQLQIHAGLTFSTPEPSA